MELLRAVGVTISIISFVIVIIATLFVYFPWLFTITNFSMERGEVLQKISSISSVDELIDLVLHHMTLHDKENDALLAKALQFEEELSKDDWLDILQSSEPGSNLERVARDKSHVDD